MKNTYGKNGVKPKQWIVTDTEGIKYQYSSNYLSGDIVPMIREKKVKRIDVELK